MGAGLGSVHQLLIGCCRVGVAIKKGGGSECELAGAELKSTFTT